MEEHHLLLQPMTQLPESACTEKYQQDSKDKRFAFPLSHSLPQAGNRGKWLPSSRVSRQEAAHPIALSHQMSLISCYTCVLPRLPCSQRALGMKRAAATDKHLGLQMTSAQRWSPNPIRGGFNSPLIRLLGFGVQEQAPT